MLNLYNLATSLIILISPFIIIYRILKGKEDPRRFIEKFGFVTEKKLKGNLVWFHGSSVGEILSILPVVEKFENNNKIRQILITSNTLSSAKIIKKFKFKKVTHQFFPIDNKYILNKFLKFWTPNVVFLIESEIWPNAILEIKRRNIPLLLINARITKKTFLNWMKFGKSTKNLFKKFDLCLCQNNETKRYLRLLGSRNIKKYGNLKFSEIKLLKEKILNKYVNRFFINKKILFGAISTHNTEEIFCAKVHLSLKKKYHNSVAIIIPRHIHRADEIRKDLNKLNLEVHLHSSKSKIKKNTDVYLVDTFGETNMFIKMCKIVFLGGSISKHGGHNPIEAAREGCKVIHGPNISNFKEVYKLMSKYRISSKVNDKSKFRSLIIQSQKKSSYQRNRIKKLKLLGVKILNKNYKELINYI